MIELAEALPSIVADTTDKSHQRDPETFYASHIGLCRRQAYLAKLGLRDPTALQGRFKAGWLIQQFLEESIEERHSQIEVGASMAFDVGAVQFVGRCNCYDPTEGVVYDIKPRGAWYKFHPPIQRHIDQLLVYMRGLDVERGQLIYISKTDLSDIRVWPPVSAETEFLRFDDDRLEALTTKAEAIRDEIIANGIATTTDEIPFSKCGCYLCETEVLHLSEKPDACESPTQRIESPSSRLSESGSENETASSSSPIRTGDGSQLVESDTYHIPAGLREFDIWVVWDCRQKLALAPWQEGTMYPCEWAADKPVNPHQSFEKAKMVADLPVKEIHRAWPFPDGDDLPETVKPAVLLPHNPPDPPIVFVDFDDVRDPATDEISNEAIGLVSLLDGYTELSRSGRGVHVYVRGSLPDDVGRFIAPLGDSGQIEIYDHARFTGGTWQHVEETPLDEIPPAQPAIDQIITEYGTDSNGNTGDLTETGHANISIRR